MKPRFSPILSLTVILLVVVSCSPRLTSTVATPPQESATLSRGADFGQRYTLSRMVVLSRHNIRSPLSGGGSVLARITPHTWFPWTSAPGELSLKGGVMETRMGQFFRQWLEAEGLLEKNEVPAPGTVRFYANSPQRTIATAQYFSSGMLPVANVRVEHHCEIGQMDPVFNPQITRVSDAFLEKAYSEIADLAGRPAWQEAGAVIPEEFAVLENVLDIRQSPAAKNDTTAFRTDDLSIQFVPGKEPAMKGGLKIATSAADALVLQYYEEPDPEKAAFGHRLSRKDWEKIAAVKEWYGDVLFTAPSVAVNVAHPLLQELLSEMKVTCRKFSFLCGHDSNIGSVLAALQCEPYQAPGGIEQKTPIGSKVVIECWKGADGKEYADLLLVYASADQIRSEAALTKENPPMIIQLHLQGLDPNPDGLYRLPDLENRFAQAIQRYDESIPF